MLWALAPNLVARRGPQRLTLLSTVGHSRECGLMYALGGSGRFLSPQWATMQNETIKICEKLRASYRGHGAGFGTALQAIAQGLVAQNASGHIAPNKKQSVDLQI
jgi:hypothetical protein